MIKDKKIILLVLAVLFAVFYQLYFKADYFFRDGRFSPILIGLLIVVSLFIPKKALKISILVLLAVFCLVGVLFLIVNWSMFAQDIIALILLFLYFIFPPVAVALSLQLDKQN